MATANLLARSCGDEAWLEVALAEAARAEGSSCTLALDIQGIQCAACVWLMGELFRRRAGRLSCQPGAGQGPLYWARGVFDVPAYIREVEQFGYVFGPSRRAPLPARAICSPAWGSAPPRP